MDTLRLYVMGRPRLDMTKPKTCTKCKETLPAESFYLAKGSGGREIRRSVCIPCERTAALSHWNSLPSDERKRRSRRQTMRNKGVSAEWWDATLAAQGGTCAICNQEAQKLCVDHDHKCCPGVKTCGKCVRGIICNNCNATLGFVNDDERLLEAAISYLKGYR